jgi:hypothetical protein
VRPCSRPSYRPRPSGRYGRVEAEQALFFQICPHAGGHGTLADARQAAAAATAPGALAAMIAYRDRAARLSEHGVELPGTVTSLDPGESSPLYAGTMARLTLSVEPPGGTRYEVTVKQILADTMAAPLKVGDRVTVRADPDDQQSVMLWGAPNQPRADASMDRIAQLEALQRLHENGVLTEDEFQSHKARILQG